MTLYRRSAKEILIEGLPVELPCGFVRTLGATTLGDQWYMIYRSNAPPHNSGIEVIND